MSLAMHDLLRVLDAYGSRIIRDTDGTFESVTRLIDNQRHFESDLLYICHLDQLSGIVNLPKQTNLLIILDHLGKFDETIITESNIVTVNAGTSCQDIYLAVKNAINEKKLYEQKCKDILSIPTLDLTFQQIANKLFSILNNPVAFSDVSFRTLGYTDCIEVEDFVWKQFTTQDFEPSAYLQIVVSDYYRSPVELGWSKVINFNHDFLGREALEKEVADPKRIIRTLVWNSEDVIDIYASMFQKGEHYDFIEFPRFQREGMYVDKVMKNGKFIGTTSSYGYSYYFREMICLAVLDIDQAEMGNEVTIIWGAPGHRQKEVRAIVAPVPYKPDRSRGDLHLIP